MNDDDLTLIGRRIGYGGATTAVGIRRADRRQHLYALGKTGTGKSTLLEHLLLQDIAAGEGVALLDPHGDLAERLLERIPPWRTDDLCYFNPADRERPVAFNPLDAVPAEQRHLAVSGFVGACKSIWHDSWGPRMEYILKNAAAALLELPGATLLLVPRFLTDDGYRARAVERLSDPVVRRFWRDEFMAYGKRERAEYCAPILNKIGQFLLSGAMRSVFGQERSAFDLRFTMDRGRILIVNLSKGKLGADNAHLLGSLLVSSFAVTAAGRGDVPEAERRDFYLYADEFQNFATESFADILSEARKYRLCLALFHQFEDQLPEGVRRAVFGNVGTAIAFRVGQRDAEHLAREFEHELTPADLTDLGGFEIAVKLLVHGRQAAPFRARTGLPDAPWYGRRANLIAQSRMRFGRPRERVERAIERVIGAGVSTSHRPPATAAPADPLAQALRSSW